MNKPLTLEQLREMDGRPAWGKVINSDKPGEWFIVRVVKMSHCWFLACAGSSQGFGDKDTYGKTWLAYTYPLAHIDREAWEPCYKCKEKCYWCTFNETSMCRKCKDKNKYLPRAKFCQECGRPLTEEAWQELEKRVRVEK